MPTYSASRIIDRALLSIGVIEAEESATADQHEDAKDALNDLVNEWDERGIGGGFADVETSDELILDPGEYRALRLNLAIDLADHYGVRVTDSMARAADLALRFLEAKYSAPSTLCIDPALQEVNYDISEDNYS